MKPTQLLLSCFIFLLSSCQYSKGVKKDLATGLSANYNGFAMDEIFLVDSDKKRLTNNIVPLGNTVYVIATGVKNYTEEDGKVFPGCTIVLTDKNKKQLLNLPDAFAEMSQGLPPEEAVNLQASLNTGSPMVAGETYYLAVRFFDKKK
ncbi:MAG: hypothetical protein EOO01_17835, partial [Chitinophagaceae bacterium]